VSLGLALLGVILWSHGAGALAALGAHVSALLLLAFVASLLAVIACLSWRWYGLLDAADGRLPLTKLALYRSAAHTLAVLIPSGKVGGDPLRAWLTVRAGVPPGPAIASVVVDRTQEIGATTPFTVVFATLLLQAGIPQIEQALVTVVIGFLGLALGVVVAVGRLRRGAGLVSALARSTRMDRLSFVRSQLDVIEASEHSILRLSEQIRRMLLAFLVGIVANALVVFEFALLLAAFDLPVTPTAVAAALFATGAAHMLPVPAGVGVLEGAQMWIFGMLGHSADVGLAVGLAVRLRELLWMLPGVVYLISRSPTGSGRGLGRWGVSSGTG
jgi:uncharacterized protein (TIRG00374 family)